MVLGELLYRISEAGLTMRCEPTGDSLYARPRSAVTAELEAEIREHKMAIIKALREDEEMRRTGIIQSERQVFDLLHEYLAQQGDAGTAA